MTKKRLSMTYRMRHWRSQVENRVRGPRPPSPFHFARDMTPARGKGNSDRPSLLAPHKRLARSKRLSVMIARQSKLLALRLITATGSGGRGQPNYSLPLAASGGADRTSAHGSIFFFSASGSLLIVDW